MKKGLRKKNQAERYIQGEAARGHLPLGPVHKHCQRICAQMISTIDNVTSAALGLLNPFILGDPFRSIINYDLSLAN